MHTLSSSILATRGSDSFSASWRRVMRTVRLVLDELHLALMAAQRYEQLRAAGDHARASKATQVFVEFYADTDIGPRHPLASVAG